MRKIVLNVNGIKPDAHATNQEILLANLIHRLGGEVHAMIHLVSVNKLRLHKHCLLKLLIAI